MSVDTTLVHKIRNDPDLPPIAVDEPPNSSPVSRGIFLVIAVVAAVGWAMLAIVRGERVNAVWLVLAAVGSYLIALRFYARFIEYRVLKPRDTRMTPGEEFENGRDFMPTDRRVLFGHHFAAIAGAGPLVGPVLAAQMGYLPGTLWIILGVIFAGAVQDYMVLHMSIRRRGRSLGQMAREELGRVGGWAALLGVLSIMIILIAVLGLVVVGALAQSPWGVYSIAMTIPIALFMGVYLRFLRPGKVGEVSAIGVALLLFAVISGQWVAESSWGSSLFTLSPTALGAVAVRVRLRRVGAAGVAAAGPARLPVDLHEGRHHLRAGDRHPGHRRPSSRCPPLTQFGRDGTGPAFAGTLFPFLFITIACGAISGFHSLIASGTTPEAHREGEPGSASSATAACSPSRSSRSWRSSPRSILDQHLYFVMNAPAGTTGGTADTAAKWVNSLPLTSPGGLPLDPTTPQAINDAATAVGEKTIVSRTGGAPTLAVGMSEVMSFLGGARLKAFWYHFAVMFEALFILTTVDAGTRVARFMFSDMIGNIPGLSKFKDPSWQVGTWLCSFLIVLGWGSILVMGVTDPLGGINTLFPLFGIANQLLAAIALTVVYDRAVQEGAVQVGVGARSPAAVGAHRDDDRVVAEDLLLRPRRSATGPTTRRSSTRETPARRASARPPTWPRWTPSSATPPSRPACPSCSPPWSPSSSLPASWSPSRRCAPAACRPARSPTSRRGSSRRRPSSRPPRSGRSSPSGRRPVSTRRQ